MVSELSQLRCSVVLLGQFEVTDNVDSLGAVVNVMTFASSMSVMRGSTVVLLRCETLR